MISKFNKDRNVEIGKKKKKSVFRFEVLETITRNEKKGKISRDLACLQHFFVKRVQFGVWRDLNFLQQFFI